MEPDGAEASVQWLIDGNPIDGPVPAGVHTSTVHLPGGQREVELRVIKPDGAQGDLEQVDFPGPQPTARIAVAEFDEDDGLDRAEGERIAVAEFEDDDWDESERIAVAEFEDDDWDESERIAVAEFEDEGLIAAPDKDDGPAPVNRITIDSQHFDPHSVLQSSGKVDLVVASGGQSGLAIWSIDSVDISGPVPTPGTHTFSIQATGQRSSLKATLQPPSPLPSGGVDPLQGDSWSASRQIDVPGVAEKITDELRPDLGAFEDVHVEWVGNCLSPGEEVVHG